MARKKILTLILIVLAIIVVAVVFATVFSVRNVNIFFYDEDGDMIAVPDQSFTADQILQTMGASNILFLSKTDALSKINSTFVQYHALEVTKVFPNTVTVHFVKRTAVLKLVFGNNVIFVDSFGYITEHVDSDTIDITSLFSSPPTNAEVGSRLEYSTAADNDRIAVVLETIGVVWQLKYRFSDVPKIVADISFGQDGSLNLSTKNGTKILVYSPQTNLTERLIHGFSVYYNDMIDLQRPGITITISETGDISHTLQ